MQPLLFYRPGTCSLSELIVLEWIGKPYTLCRVTREEQASPEFLALNPAGTVPVMRFGDTVVYENNALLAYLADTHPELELAPRSGTLERAHLDQWLAYLDSGFHAAHFPFFKPGRFLADETQHDALRETSKQRVQEHLARLDKHLVGRYTVLGPRRTVVDAYMAAMVRWGRKFCDYAKDYPDLDRYLVALDQDPGVARAKHIESFGTPPPKDGLAEHVAFPG